MVLVVLASGTHPRLPLVVNAEYSFCCDELLRKMQELVGRAYLLWLEGACNPRSHVGYFRSSDLDGNCGQSVPTPNFHNREVIS